MATQQAVNAGSNYCRDCGGPIKPRDELAWCENITTSGSQQDPKDVCENLTKHTRRFCEHCGQAIAGPIRCQNCNLPPTNP
jgi:hypothetical protein